MSLPRSLFVILVTCLLCWAGGLVWFINATRREMTSPPAHSDGVVALTGGARRVEVAFQVLMQGYADKLLLTGVGKDTDLATLARLSGLDAERFANRITLGRYAASTRGNAIETAAWANQNRIGTLIVVTATYHMPRAMVELGRALPHVHLVPLPVVAGAGPSLTLQAEEFSKYLVSVSGLTAWLPLRETSFKSAVPTGSGK